MKKELKKNYEEINTNFNGDTETAIKSMESRIALLPYLYQDVLALSFGLGEYDPISDKEIAEIYTDENHITFTEDQVSGIIKDALYMLRYMPENHEVISLKDELPDGISDELHGVEIGWNMVKHILYSNTEEDDFDKYLSNNFGDADYVIVPPIDSIYTTMNPCYNDPEAFDKVLTNGDIWDYRGIVELIVEELDKKGICVVRDMRFAKEIRPEDIYRYAYLDKNLAKKIAYDNPLKLIKKNKKLRGDAEKGEK